MPSNPVNPNQLELTVSTIQAGRALTIGRLMTDNDATRSTFDHETVRSASKLIVIALSLVFLLSLVRMLPGIDRLIPNTPLSFAALVSAIVTVVVAGLLVYAAPKLATLTRVAVGPTELPDTEETGDVDHDLVAENAAGVVYWLVVLAAVIVTHRGFAGAILPFLEGMTWMYDAAFLLVSLVPVTFVTARLAATVNPLSTRIADRVAGDSDDR